MSEDTAVLCERVRTLDRLYLAWDRALTAWLQAPCDSPENERLRREAQGARRRYDRLVAVGGT